MVSQRELDEAELALRESEQKLKKSIAELESLTSS